MPNNWKKYKFSDFVEINPTIRFSKDELYSFVEMKDLNENNKYVLPSAEKGVTGGARFEENDTLFARITPCLQNGKICQVKGLKNNVGFGSTEFLIFRGKDGISDTDFVYYLSREEGVRKFAEQNMIGTSGRQRVVKDAFQNLILELPPLPEQQAIAEILSSLDDKIELNLQTNKTLEEMANALYKHWFVDFGPFLPSGRCPQDGRGPIPGFIESELGLIPEGWEVVKVDDLFNLTIGRTPPRKEQHWFSEDSNDVKWISIKDMGNSGSYIFNTSEYLTREAVEKHNVPVIPINTVVLSFKLTVGRIAITTESMLSNEAIAHFIPNENCHLTTEYVFLFLKNFDFDSLGSTSSIATAVNSQTIKKINVLVPTKEIADLFQIKVADLFNQIKCSTLEIETLKQTRDYLLPKLISGEIRVKDAEKYTSRPPAGGRLLKEGI